MLTEKPGVFDSEDSSIVSALGWETLLSRAGQPKRGTPTSTLLHHLLQNVSVVFGPANISSVLPLARPYPFLQNTLLAVAASHLRHVAPQTRLHRLAEHSQQSLALRDYQAAINTPLHQLGQTGTDALLLTAMLFNMLAFALPWDETTNDPSEADLSLSWVFSTRPSRLNWLSLQLGLKPLLMATEAFRAESALAPIFSVSDDAQQSFARDGESLDPVPVTWIDAFGLSQVSQPMTADSSTVAQGPMDPRILIEEPLQMLFREPVRVLAKLRDLEPSKANIFRYLQFVGKLGPGFCKLLEMREERALWIFAYWLGLLCRFHGLWWCSGRARRDFLAAREWLRLLKLRERPGPQGKLWAELMVDLDLSSQWGGRQEVLASASCI